MIMSEYIMWICVYELQLIYMMLPHLLKYTVRREIKTKFVDLGDCWHFHTDTKKWIRISENNHSPRLWHKAVFFKVPGHFGELNLVGGNKNNVFADREVRRSSFFYFQFFSAALRLERNHKI